MKAKEIATLLDTECQPAANMLKYDVLTWRKAALVLMELDRINAGRYPFKSAHKASLRHVRKLCSVSCDMGIFEKILEYVVHAKKIINSSS